MESSKRKSSDAARLSVSHQDVYFSDDLDYISGKTTANPLTTCRRLLSSVAIFMTVHAKRDQVLYHVATELAPRFHMMDLQILHRTALLTPPTISLQHAVSEQCIFLEWQFEPRLPLAEAC
jgi:hypothetical protein